MIDCELLLRRDARDYRWTPVAGPIAPAHYDAAIADLSARGRSIPGVVALYDFGPIRYPGLSDIDLLFVVRDDFAAFDALRALLHASVAPRYHNVLLHNPYFVRARELPLYFKFAPFFELNRRWGTGDADLPARLSNDDPLDLTLFLLDIVIDAYPWEFVRYLTLERIDERELMSRVKGLSYCFALLDRIGARQAEGFRARAAALSEAIAGLRERYFDLAPVERQARLLTLTQRAVGLSQELIGVLAEHLRAAWGLRLAGDLILSCTRVAALYRGAAPAEPRVGAVRLRRTDYYVQQPVELGYVVWEYMQRAGPVTNRFRRRSIDRLRVEQAPAPAIREAIGQRADLRNDHQAWLDRMALGHPGFMTFGYRTRQRGGGGAARRIAGRVLDAAREALLRRRLIALRDGGE
ncbi:MAG TPA: hypothetical protein PK847_04410 [Candidatus Sumerlaeota bacterium]|nr:hypothetical protein [Candidatus Sumerlaeota bacterium]